MSYIWNVIYFWDLNRVNMMKCLNVNNCNCMYKNLKIVLFFLRKLYLMLWFGYKSLRIICFIFLNIINIFYLGVIFLVYEISI